MSLDLNHLQQLINDFQRLPAAPATQRTFLEIAGFPHYENVCSNILAFYLDPAEAHGLGDLVLRALLAAAGHETVSSNPLTGVEVNREVPTANSKRLDLVIKNDDLLIGIENKIYAAPYNPFTEYESYLAGEQGSRTLVRILLSLYPTASVGGWVPVRYAQLFDQILAGLEACVPTADPKYLIFLTDFINSLRKLEKGTGMDKSFIDFINQSDNKKGVLQLCKAVKDLRNDMRSHLETLARDWPLPDCAKGLKWQFWPDPDSLADVLFLHLPLKTGNKLVLDLVLEPSGWRLDIRGEPRPAMTATARGILENLAITGWKEVSDGRFLLANFPGYGGDLGLISQAMNGWIEALCGSLVLAPVSK